MLQKFFSGIGKYILFLQSVFTGLNKRSLNTALFWEHCSEMLLRSLPLILALTTGIGAVSAMQTAYNISQNPFYPKFVIAVVTRDSILLEVAPTITAMVMAGRLGSDIAAGIGNMRISEQIDVLEVMGLNTASYLTFSRCLAALIVFPVFCSFAFFCGLCGGYLAGTQMNLMTGTDFIEGIRYDFVPLQPWVSLLKSSVFGFLVVSISAYHGFTVKGGSLEVGKASMNAVTISLIGIVAADFLIANLFY